MFAWEIYTYGGGEVLQQVFNGIVAIVGADTYSTFRATFESCVRRYKLNSL